MCHYNQQRSRGIPHTVQAHHRFEKFLPPRGKVFNPFVAFCRSKGEKAREKKKKEFSSLSSYDHFRVRVFFKLCFYM